jgi:hypothetical protein
MWTNRVESDRPQMTIWRMRIAYWLPKAINAYSEYVLLVAFPLQQYLQERTPMLPYTYIVCLVHFRTIPPIVTNNMKLVDTYISNIVY